jgi:Tfp pilus assembly protein PilO
VKISHREIVLSLSTLTVALFGASSLLVKPRLQEWKALRLEQEEARKQIELDSRLISQRGTWAKQFATLSEAMPRQPADKEVDVYWLSVIDELAKKNGIQIRRIEAGKEKRQGDVYELPIECKEWEGNLSGLVHFLFDLQAKGAMLDIRHLMIKPRAKGVLSGRFELSCAYMRVAKAEAAVKGSEAK